MEEYDNTEDAIRAARAHQEQHIEAHRHEVRRLFVELPLEHLSTLNDFLAIIATSGEQAAGTAAHFHGVAKTYLETRFNICSACGVDHDEAAKKELLKGSEEASGQMPLPLPFPPHEHSVFGVAHTPQQSQEPGEQADPYPDLPEHVKQFMEDSGLVGTDYGPFLKIGENGRLNLPQVKMMEAYYLDDVRDADTKTLLGFICVRTNPAGQKCQGTYQTIEDRMLKSPDDCHYCQIRAAHG